MTESLRKLMDGAIDYAGLFPPASLPLEATVHNYTAYRHRPEAWMLGRLVCPASRLAELPALMGATQGRRFVTALGRGSDTIAQFMQHLDDDLDAIRQFPEQDWITAFELRLPGDAQVARSWDALEDVALFTVRHIQEASLVGPLTLYLEVPCLDETPVLATILATHNRAVRNHNRPVGLKFRTGGVTPIAVPATTVLAEAICTAGLFWKATAGLHHPLRHFNAQLGAHMHGFLNVLCAAVLEEVHRLDAVTIGEILADEDADHFRFTDEALCWRDLSVAANQIAVARERSMHSFGSCSFDEPCHDLKALGVL